MGIIVRSYLKDGQVVVCRTCDTHLSTPDNVISKVVLIIALFFMSFCFRTFKASMVVPFSMPKCIQVNRPNVLLCRINVDEGGEELKAMTTGQHVVKDIFCRYCGQKLGWKYVRDHPNMALFIISG